MVRGLYYKTLLIRKLREMDRFRNKRVTFSLDKYTLAWIKKTPLLNTESVDYEPVIIYSTGPWANICR
jgi:hypothetical protein